jgi:hypothetical protein
MVYQYEGDGICGTDKENLPSASVTVPGGSNRTGHFAILRKGRGKCTAKNKH